MYHILGSWYKKAGNVTQIKLVLTYNRNTNVWLIKYTGFGAYRSTSIQYDEQMFTTTLHIGTRIAVRLCLMTKNYPDSNFYVKHLNKLSYIHVHVWINFIQAVR